MAKRKSKILKRGVTGVVAPLTSRRPSNKRAAWNQCAVVRTEQLETVYTYDRQGRLTRIRPTDPRGTGVGCGNPSDARNVLAVTADHGRQNRKRRKSKHR